MLPDQPDVHGLAALVEISATRLATRVDGSGDLVLLEDQDRSRWDRQAIANGRAAIERALRAGVPGPMTVQAMIAACHAAARTWESTDWESIAALYDQLYSLSPSPVVALNRAVAISMSSSPETALALVDDLINCDRAHYPLAWATRADMLRRLGRHQDSAAAYPRGWSARSLMPRTSQRRHRRHRRHRVRDSDGTR